MTPVLMMLSREVRRVPMDYEPPKEGGHYQPIYDEFYEVALSGWIADREAWNSDADPDRARYPTMTWEEWSGPAPDPAYYLPGSAWPEGAVLGIRMYETVTEGTPISAAYPDTVEGRRAMAEELATVDSGITSGLTADEWLAVIEGQVMAKDIHTGELS